MGLKMGLCFVENWLGVIKVEFMANISPWLLPPTHKAIINFTTHYNYEFLFAVCGVERQRFQEIRQK